MSSSPSNLRALIVEDGKELRDLLGDVLRSNGFTVMAVDDGLKAIQAFRRHAFDIVLTDLVMPGCNGLHVAKACKEHRPTVKVIVLTAWDLLINDEECVAYGVDLIIAKPVKMSVLVRALHEVTHDSMPFQRSPRALLKV